MKLTIEFNINAFKKDKLEELIKDMKSMFNVTEDNLLSNSLVRVIRINQKELTLFTCDNLIMLKHDYIGYRHVSFYKNYIFSISFSLME